jgi:hypothetical protein
MRQTALRRRISITEQLPINLDHWRVLQCVPANCEPTPERNFTRLPIPM